MDFSEIARKAKEAQAQRDDEKDTKLRASAAEADLRFSAQVEILEERVEPALREAAAAFGAHGFPCVVGDNWRDKAQGRPLRPTFEFQVVGARTENKHGGHYVSKGRSAFFYVDQGDVGVTLGKDNYERFGSQPVLGATLDERIESALSTCLESYLADDARHRRGD